jgi:predicted nucleic-acid-binding protein
MHAVDTNVLVRLLADDEPDQAAVAQQVMASESVFVAKTVVLELEWVLRSVYRLSPASIATGIEGLLATAAIEVEDAAAVSRAVAWFREGLDFADALHLASSSHVGTFLTFHASLRRRAAALGTKPQVATP